MFRRAGATLVAAAVLAVALADSRPAGGQARSAGRTSSSTTTATASASAPASRPTLTIATYNICFVNSNLNAVLKTLQQCGADVIALQESNEQSVTFFRAGLGKTYSHLFFQHAPAAGGLAVFSKLPLKNPRYQRPTIGWFGTVTFEIELAGIALFIEDLHLTATVPEGKQNLLQMLDLYMRTEDIRLKEITAVFQGLPADKRTILLGDFNSEPEWAASKFVIGKGFVDSLAAADPKAAKSPTWHGKFGGADYQYHLDYIYHDKQFKTLESRIVPGEGSDHYMVMSKLELPASRPAGPTSNPSPATQEGR